MSVCVSVCVRAVCGWVSVCVVAKLKTYHFGPDFTQVYARSINGDVHIAVEHLNKHT